MASVTNNQQPILAPPGTPTPRKPATRGRGQKMPIVQVIEVSDNTDQSLIQIAEDRLARILDAVLRKNDMWAKAWALVGIFFSTSVEFLLGILTGTPHDFVLSDEVWEGILSVLTIISFLLFVYNLRQALRLHRVSTKEIIANIKGESNSLLDST
jgi:hypothetical protein